MNFRSFLALSLSLVFCLALNATIHTIAANGTVFSPAALTIVQGDTVVWNNLSGVHNVNGTQTTFPLNPVSFTNGAPSGSNWSFSFQFTAAGTYSFVCDQHAPGMSGLITVISAPTDLVLTGVYDADLPGGLPKGVELYVLNNIPDLSNYGLGSANNGQGSDGEEYTFPAVSAAAGSYIHITYDSTSFHDFFGFNADYYSGAVNVNGDDALELFSNGTVIDVYGNINVDGSGEAWEYKDSWAYRTAATGPDDSTFVAANWTFAGIAALDGFLTNAGAINPFPLETYGNLTPLPLYPAYTIAQLSTNDVTGLADSIAVKFEFTATIFTTDFDADAGYDLYIHDASGGIHIYSAMDINGYANPQQGDMIKVFGEIQQQYGLTHAIPDSIILISSNNVLTSPSVVTFLNENSESERIRMNGYFVVNPTQWPAAGMSAQVDITNGSDTISMKIDSDTDIDGSVVPAGAMDIIGAGSQSDSSSPYLMGYAIQPSQLSDILVTPPVISDVNFQTGLQMESENVGNITVNVVIDPVQIFPKTIDFQAVLGANVTIPSDGMITPLPDLSTGIFQLSVPANEDTVSFQVSVTDDAVIEGNETLFVHIVAVAPNLSIGTTSTYTLVIEDNDKPVPIYDIADVTGINSSGAADSLNVECVLHGTVFTDDFEGGSGLSFYMYDSSGGINVFNFIDVSNYTVARGDSLRVKGKIEMYNGLIELLVDSIAVLGSGHSLKIPDIVGTLDEFTESEYIRMNGMALVDTSQWPVSAGPSVNVDITNGTDTFKLRIDSDVDLNGSPVPIGILDIIGAGSQYDSAAPYSAGYQIVPRDLNDVIIQLPRLAITEIMPASSLAVNGDWFELTNYGTAAVNLKGYSWDDDNKISGTHTINGNLTIVAGQSIIFLDEADPDDSAWAHLWMQTANGLVVIGNDDFGGMGFSALDNGGDEVNLYDGNGILVQTAVYTSTDVMTGFSIQFDSSGTSKGPSANGINGAYTSLGTSGDVGNPGNKMPISIDEHPLSEINIYPIPSAGKFFINTHTPAKKHITLLSLNGKILMEFFGYKRLIEVNTTAWPAGVYMVVIEIEKSKAIYKIVVP